MSKDYIVLPARGRAIQEIDSRTHDCFSAADLPPHLAGIFDRLARSGENPSDYVVAVKIPRQERMERQRKAASLAL